MRKYLHRFFNWSVSVRVGSFLFPLELDIFFFALADVGMAFFDKFVGIVHHLFEIVTGEADFIGSVVEPFDVLLNLCYELMALFLRVGIVKS